MSSISVDIYDLALKVPVSAALRGDLTALDLVEAESFWSPARYRSVAAMLRAGVKPQDIPQHNHWNWWLKSSELDYLDTEAVGITHQDRWQGLMMITTSTLHRSRIESQRGKELVYVKYLESAPWNVSAFTRAVSEKPLFGAIGTRLLEFAVRRSLQHGFRGRVGLHALPNHETESFYQRRGMQLRTDPAVDDLPYYEFSEKDAIAFVKEGE